MARPKIEIDTDEILRLAEVGCTNREIAYVVGVSESLIGKRFSNILEKGRETGKTRLRQMQWAAASKGNVAMLIWLGKQYLGQRDHSTIDEDVEALAAKVRAAADAIERMKPKRRFEKKPAADSAKPSEAETQGK